MKTVSLTAAAVLLCSTAAFAQDQEGLVNLSVDGNTVQVPVSVAANVCDIAVDVLSADFVGTEETVCEIDQQTAATNDIAGYEDAPGQGGGNQNGLVNVSVDGNTVQVPIGVAANVCGVAANVLARDFTGSDSTACEIDQETAAANNFPTLTDAEGADTTIDGAAGAVEDAAGEEASDAADEATDTAEDAADTAADTVKTQRTRPRMRLKTQRIRLPMQLMTQRTRPRMWRAKRPILRPRLPMRPATRLRRSLISKPHQGEG